MQVFIALGILAVGVSAVLAYMGYRGREQVVGIDLGTTFSVVAVKRKGNVELIPDWPSQKLLLPSVVHFSDDGSYVVGREAVAKRREYPRQTIFNAKRFIGRTMADVTEDAAAHPFRVAPNSSFNVPRSSSDPKSSELEPGAGFIIPAEGGERWLSPIDVSSKVIARMKRSVEKYMGYPMHRAVVCVPAKFGPRETKATLEAFAAGGIKVMRVLEEPTSAAVAYNLHKGSSVKYVLVYDLGGGTLDTSLLYMNGRSISNLGVAGDDHLGGSDFDQRMRGVLESKVATAPLAADGTSRTSLPSCNSNGLGIIAEEAKKQLSSDMSTEVQCMADDGAARTITVTRKEFEDASADLFDRSMVPVEKVLEDQMMSADQVDDIVLVGGASRTPRIRELLASFLGEGKSLHSEIDPDTVVAYGAANILD